MISVGQLAEEAMIALGPLWTVAGPIAGKAFDEGAKESAKKLVDWLASKFHGRDGHKALIEAVATPDTKKFRYLKAAIEDMAEEDVEFRVELLKMLKHSGHTQTATAEGDGSKITQIIGSGNTTS